MTSDIEYNASCCQDNGFPLPRQAHMTLRVNISDSDDQGPAFLYPDCPMLDGYCTTPLYEAALKKSFKGVLKIWPGHIKAVDMDSLNNSITYVIVSVAPEEYSSNFEMDPMSGEVRVIKEFDRDDIDAIHVTVKAEENSAARRFITSTMRVQVIGDLYTSYNDRFRNVPINDVTSLPQSQDDIQNTATLPISLFTATVIVFFLVIVVFPFVVLKFLKGKLLSEQTTVPSLSPLTRSGNLMRCSKRKESADTTTASIMSCGSTDTTCTTVFGNHHLDDDSNSDITSSSSSSSSPSSVHLDFVDSVAFGSSLVDQTRRVSSVAFDPEEIALRLGPGAPSRTEQNAADKLKRRLNELCSFHSCKDNKKSRVRFDIRNVSSFS
ncbi:uncharacterized protein LOC112569793 [Pomacea canaliculata]|uniref:uncharacterized protein LOC112569793 n=1 Tax=Pomacea canaliculata TaxID=400727 RepID=UPI000D7309F0|nr:uncharacterized protein LOC112569793 [Pomacea canaliculata]